MVAVLYTRVFDGWHSHCPVVSVCICIVIRCLTGYTINRFRLWANAQMKKKVFEECNRKIPAIRHFYKTPSNKINILKPCHKPKAPLTLPTLPAYLCSSNSLEGYELKHSQIVEHEILSVADYNFGFSEYPFSNSSMILKAIFDIFSAT